MSSELRLMAECRKVSVFIRLASIAIGVGVPRGVPLNGSSSNRIKIEKSNNAIFLDQ